MIVNLIGRLGADAEVKSGKNGNQFISFRVAADEFKNGSRGTVWFNVITDSNERNMKIVQYLTKGRLINITGTETCDIYFNKNNEPQISRDIRAFNVDFVSSSQQNTEQSNQNSNQSTSQVVDSNITVTPQIDCGTLRRPTQAPTQAPIVEVDSTDDLPF